MPKPLLFSVVATAAHQADLDHPKFATCLDSWRNLSRRVLVVVPKDAQVPALGKSVRIHRSRTSELLLNDVVTEAARAGDDTHPDITVLDPLTRIGSPLLGIFKVVEKRLFKSVWMASALPIELGPEGEEGVLAQQFPPWFLAPANFWRFILALTPENIPATFPLWSGWLAAKVEERMSPPSRYFDATRLHGIGSYRKNVQYPDVAGEWILTFNTPATSYFKEEPVAVS